MVLRWKTLRKQGGARHWGNRKVLPDPNSDPDKNSFLPLSCSPSSRLELGNKAGCGARTLSLTRLYVPEKQPLAAQQLLRSVPYCSLALRRNHVSETSCSDCPCDVLHSYLLC